MRALRFWGTALRTGVKWLLGTLGGTLTVFGTLALGGIAFSPKVMDLPNWLVIVLIFLIVLVVIGVGGYKEGAPLGQVTHAAGPTQCGVYGNSFVINDARSTEAPGSPTQ